jgi:hypothetical protein
MKVVPITFIPQELHSVDTLPSPGARQSLRLLKSPRLPQLAQFEEHPSSAANSSDRSQEAQTPVRPNLLQ